MPSAETYVGDRIDAACCDERRLPFEVKAPSQSSRQALAEIAAGKVASFANLDDLMSDLHTDD